MPQPIVECIPNFSEGRNKATVDQIVASIKQSGCKVLDVSMDASHNRSVITFVGSPQQVEQAAFSATKTAANLINMEVHRGEHPRIGATDVIPLVPIRDVTMEDCNAMARRLGRRIGEELKIPVYLYAKSATRPDRVRLPDIRKGEYEGLKVAIQNDPDRVPDFGPRCLHPTAGATVVGARPPLIAFNVNLDSSDVKIARAIARIIRESSGGFPAVQAKGIFVEETGLAQVTMNLLDYKETSLETVFGKIEEEARLRGTRIKSSEIVGLVPLDCLLDVVASKLALKDFSRDKILDLAVDKEIEA